MHWCLGRSEKLGCLFPVRGSWACMQTVPLRCGEMCDIGHVFILTVTCWFPFSYWIYNSDRLNAVFYLMGCSQVYFIFMLLAQPGELVLCLSKSFCRTWKLCCGKEKHSLHISSEKPSQEYDQWVFREGVLRRIAWKSNDFVILTGSFWNRRHSYRTHISPKCLTLSGRINIFTKKSRIDAELGEYVTGDILVAKPHLGDGRTSLFLPQF